MSTYRVQLRDSFGFGQAAEQAGYLAALGVTHVYLSPILQANPGSPHGYDVVDHSLVSADLGGEPAFREMVAEFHRHGLGVVVDVVPNHMARPTPRRSTGSCGRCSTRAGSRSSRTGSTSTGRRRKASCCCPSWPGRWRSAWATSSSTPRPRNPENAAGHRGPVLRYYDHVLPLRDGVADLPLGVLLAQQHYRLTDWHDAATQLNYRRFFDVDSLIARPGRGPGRVRRHPRVLLRLVREGLIDGLRVDHPDGLADPRGYLARLAAETGGAWVVVEKILAHGEELPGWPCAGTTGYDALGTGRRPVHRPRAGTCR